MSTKMLLAILFFSFLVDFLALFSISTHRMGSDKDAWWFDGRLFISTRTPRVGSDSLSCSGRNLLNGFQPALPVWGVI